MKKYLENISAEITKTDNFIQVRFKDGSFYRIDETNVTIFSIENRRENQKVLIINNSNFYNLNWLMSKADFDMLSVTAIDDNGITVERYSFFAKVYSFKQKIKYKDVDHETSKMLDYCNIIHFIKNEIIKFNPKIKKEILY